MQIFIRFSFLVVLFGIIATIAACCDRQSPQTPKIAANAVAPTTQPPPAASPSVQPYSATLAEGINFSKPGYPDFLAHASGISGYEPWGRWTDGGKVNFRFTQPLPKQFTLVIQANAFGPNLGEVVKIKIGAAQQEFRITESSQVHRFTFNLTDFVDTIELLIPKPTSPKTLKIGEDPRELGLGLIKLQILDEAH
ncbi:MAG: hypothetical protein IPK09_14825 [Candidatus Competibacteraceae bacterium]|nr:hypothetical protein [Candidatus Competibacteraceae bacterium]